MKLSEEDIAILNSSKVILSFSGGKDSTACGLILEENNIPFQPVFMDTGWEHPVVLEYIRQEIEPRWGRVEIIKSHKYPGGMAEIINKKGIFPSRRIRWCTEELKIKPWRRYLKSLDGPVVSVVGIRRQESKSRSAAKRWEYDPKTDADVFRPLVDLSFDDVIRIHQDKNMPPNPLYLHGAERVGCFPCIFSRKSEVELLSRLWPERIEEISKMEKELTERRIQKDPSASTKATFFGERSAVIGSGDINSVVEWSKTARGGRQLALFNHSAQDGCTRWGMCESPMAREDAVKIGGEDEAD